ncbi:MAG: hypothetical protein ACFE9L_02425 [Candidatus Hodarchaeota archaeon]
MSQKSHLTKEYEALFGNLNSRLELLQKTQEETIEQYITQLPDYIPRNFKKIIAASYLLCLTEEIFQVTFTNFRIDMITFCTMLGFNFRQSSGIASYDFVNEYLTKFVQILKVCSDTLQEMLTTFIVELASGYNQGLLQTLVIMDYLKPLFNEMQSIIDKDVDLRFLSAILTTTIEDFIDRKSRLKKGQEIGNSSIVAVYEVYKKHYPLSQGKDLIFDLCNKLTIEHTWKPLETLVQKEIDAMVESIAIQREDSLAQYQANIAREKEMYSDDYFVFMITGRLFELFVLDRPITNHLRTGIVNAVDVMVRRYLIDKHGYVSASGEETLEIACNLLWGTVWEIPQIIAAVLDPKEIMEIMKTDNPRKWVTQHERDLKARFSRLLSRYAGKNPMPAVIGNAFMTILETAQKMRVRITFD